MQQQHCNENDFTQPLTGSKFMQDQANLARQKS